MASVRIMALSELLSVWRCRADELSPYAPAAAEAFRKAAEELQIALRDVAGELLTLEEAAAASGYSRDHLGRAVRTGKIANAGRANAPRIRRSDLPVKPGRLSPIEAKGYSAITDARALRSRRLGGTNAPTV